MNNLLKLRKEHNITQSEIATMLGVTRQAYSRYELGARELGYDMLLNLAEYYGVSIDYLLGHKTNIIEKDNIFTPDDYAKGVRNTVRIPINSSEMNLIDYYRELDKKKQILLIEFAKKLKDI